jgi:hypothetical protein
MTRNTQLTWRLGIESLLLMAAIAVRCFTRLNPPELLASLQAAKPILLSQIIDRVQSLGPYFEWAPLGKVKLITNTTTAPWEAP